MCCLAHTPFPSLQPSKMPLAWWLWRWITKFLTPSRNSSQLKNHPTMTTHHFFLLVNVLGCLFSLNRIESFPVVDDKDYGEWVNLSFTLLEVLFLFSGDEIRKFGGGGKQEIEISVPHEFCIGVWGWAKKWGKILN